MVTLIRVYFPVFIQNHLMPSLELASYGIRLLPAKLLSHHSLFLLHQTYEVYFEFRHRALSSDLGQ